MMKELDLHEMQEIVKEFVQETREGLAVAQEILSETSKRSTHTSNVDNDAMLELGRIFHTIKGTAATLELGELTDLAHEAEENLVDVHKNRTVLQQQIAGIEKELLAILDDAAAYHSVEDHAKSQRERSESEMLSRWLGSYLPIMAESLAHRCGKLVRVYVEPVTCAVDAELYRQIKEGLVHLTRNAIAHGIESPTERERNGKQPYGTIRVALTYDSKTKNYTLTFQDDGQGIDLDSLRARADINAIELQSLVENGDGNDLFVLVSMPGVTTWEYPDELAGRGLGLSILKKKLDDQGGSVSIENRRAIGLTVSMVIPLNSRGGD